MHCFWLPPPRPHVRHRRHLQLLDACNGGDAVARAQERFDKVDANANGSISSDEITSWVEGQKDFLENGAIEPGEFDESLARRRMAKD